MHPRPERTPLGGADSELIRKLPRDLVLGELAAYFGGKPPDDAVTEDYELWRCVETGLEFSWPMVPGNQSFYEWLGRQNAYYPGSRWEYGRVAERIQTHAEGRDIRVLDVGAGTGAFLSGLAFLPPASRHAIDLSRTAIAACLASGFQGFCGTVEDAARDLPFGSRGFDAVTSFHCLEHVPDPMKFTRGLMALLAPGGRAYISTPYSPMSFEEGWFDVMNHPPHHMTRWNLRAYEKLATLVGAGMEYFKPPTYAVKKSLTAWSLATRGKAWQPDRFELLGALALGLPGFVQEWANQRHRARHHPLGGSDVILVELTKPRTP